MIILGSEQLLQIVLAVAALAMAAVAAVFLLVVRGTRRRRGRGWVWGFAYFGLALAFDAFAQYDPVLEAPLTYLATAAAAVSAYFTAATAFELKGVKFPFWANGVLALCVSAAFAIAIAADLTADLLAPELALGGAMAIFAIALLPVARDKRRSAVRTLCVIAGLIALFILRTLVSSAILAFSGRQLTAVYWTWEVIFGVILAFVLSMGELVALVDEIRFEMEEANAALNEALRGLEIAAKIDPLTGLYNRYAFYTLVGELREQGRLAGSIVILDLNNLKKINDTFGHDAGDRALLSVAQRMREAVRSSDHVFRWGGDEFVLLLPAMPAEAARERMARMEPPQALELSVETRVELSLSWGVAAITGNVDASLRDADAQLYSQKRLIKQAVQMPEAP